MGWPAIFAYLVAGFLLLAYGAKWLVGGSRTLARRLGIGEIVVGLTIVAWGTSAPELVISSLAAARGEVELSLGNVLGSNVANIGLVLGASALVLPGVLHGRLAPREAFWLFASLGVLGWAAWDGGLSRREAIGMLAVFALHNLHLWITARSAGVLAGHDGDEPASGPPWLLVAGGVVAISLGAYLVVEGARDGALKLHVNSMLVGLTVVAVGTSLPELAAGVGSALQGESDISVGNVVGSNVFNLLAVMGVVGVIQPLVPEALADERSARELRSAFDAAVPGQLGYVAAFSLAMLLLPWWRPGRSGRLKGLVLVALYATYVVTTVLPAVRGT